jgi:4-amino-4-deoxy-L-arabinose transferase-like glycosyltransferase
VTTQTAYAPRDSAPNASPAAAAATRPFSWRIELLAFTAILLVAAYLRITQIESVPPGISHDEAMYALDAREVVELGVRPIYFERNNGGREPLFIYLGALSMAIVGPEPLAMRIVSIAVGLATIVAGHLLFRRMFGVRVALFADAWLAINFWHLVLSRNSFRAITLPLVLTLALLLLWIGLAERRRWAWPLGGALFGLVQYTYFADRAVPLIVVLLVGYLAIVRRDWLRACWRGLVVYVAVGCVVFTPLAVYYAAHPAIFFSRFEQVAGVGGVDPAAPESPLVNVVDALGMFSVRGDSLWGRNIANRPVFDLPGAVFFYLGLALALLRLRQPAYGFLLIWIGVMILPTALSTSAPHYLRAVGLIPAIFALPALGLDGIVDWALRRARAASLAIGAALGAVLALWLGVTAAVVHHEYFGEWAPRPEVYYGFHSEMNAIGRFLNDEVTDQPLVLLSSEYVDHPSTLFLLRRPFDIRWFDGRQSFVVPDSPDRPALFIFPWSARPADLGRWFDPASRVAERPGPGETVAFVAYRLAPGQIQELAARLAGATTDTAVGPTRLLDHRAGARVLPGATLPLTLTWQVTTTPPASADLAWFSHLIDRDGRRWGIGDANGYPSYEWRPGDLVVGRYDLAVQRETPPGEYRIAVGLYDRRTGERLPSATPDGNVFLGRVKVASLTPPAAPGRQLEARFADGITLAGYDLGDVRCRDGGCERLLRLVWRADGHPSAAYTVFVHVLDDRGRLIAQADAPPANYRQPTDLWEAGELIEDARFVPMPDAAARLLIGLYRPDRGDRLPLHAGGDAIAIPLR